MSTINPFFSVAQAPVYVNGMEVPGRMALYNEENGNVLGILSDTRYKTVTNKQVADVFEAAFDKLPILKITDHLSLDESVWKRRIVLDKSAFDLEVLPNDSMGIMVEIINSYSGKTSWGFDMFGYRWMCSNGMVMGKRSLFSQMYGHMQDAIHKIQSRFDAQMHGVENVLETWRTWAKLPMPEERFSMYLAEQEVAERATKRIIETYAERNATENLKPTQWAAFNTLTYLGTHNDRTRKGTDPAFSATNKKFFDLADGLYKWNPESLPALAA